MANVKVNAVGDQCPIPVVKATKALGEFKEAGTLEVQVDNEIAIQNLTRLADSKGLKSRSEKLGDNLFAITMEVNGPLTMGGEDLSCHTDNRGDFVVAIDTDAMGRGSDDLGRTLMKGFIYAVSQLETLPKTILFYNGGAKLTTEGSVSLEDLKSMEAQGVQILTCGTCLNFYGLADKLAVGSVTNMYVIVETLAKAGKVIKP
ncbi:MAG: sulfurtransferase-like selenium metabolism protein YedF [Eubacteriales bacterium]|nr:sulfurtransferase-like selenium metabolism protein YedF [Eubacteriales bacterium]MDY5512121.1 sulfurtransferase-like selenium metabolism protein YedF [Eubacteriales bacterium]MDY5625897.1 sulfurtransferase-like selenium metabolism protein YedF [Eubacteriales bacterium]